MNWLEEVRRTLDNQAAGFPVDDDPWELARQLLDECKVLHDQLRQIPPDLRNMF